MRGTIMMMEGVRRCAKAAATGMALGAGALLLSLASNGPATAGEISSEPILRIEAGMHTAMIKRIGLSADGTLLATGSEDRTVRLWALPEGRLIRTLRLPLDATDGGKIYSIALSPDGTLVAAGGWDAAYNVQRNHYVYILDTSNGEVRARLGPLPNVINELRFSPDGERLAAGLGANNGVRVWRSSDGRQVGDDHNYNGQVYGVRFASDGRLATTSYDGQIRLYSPTMRLLHKIKAPSGKRPFGIAFSPDGASLAVGYDDTAAVDVFTGKTLDRRYAADTSGINTVDLSKVTWSADGTTLFAGGRYQANNGRPVVAWSDRGKGARRTLSGAQDTIMDLMPLGENGVVFATADPSFGLIDGAGKLQLFKAAVTADMRNKLRDGFMVSPDAMRVRFGLHYGPRDAVLFDVGQLELADSPQPPADLSQPDTSSLPVADWEDRDGTKLGGKTLELEQYELARSAAVLPDRSGVLIGADWYLRRFNQTGKAVWKQAIPAVAWGVNLSADGRVAVAAYGDGTIRWHRTSDGAELLALFVHAPDRRWIAWTPTGYYAASPGGEDLIGWHVNRGLDKAPDFFAASRFHDRFYRPDIVQMVLGTLDERQAIEGANHAANIKAAPAIAETLPPVVTILSPTPDATFTQRDVTIRYSLRSPSGLPVDRVEVQIDGRPARGLARVDVPAGAGKDSEVKGEATVTLPAGDVTVGLLARSGDVASEVATVKLKWQGEVTRDDALFKPKLYALVVGISHYGDASLTLGLAAKDASDFAAALNAQKGGIYRDVEVRLLTDDAATSDAVLDGLDWLEKQVTSRDMAMLFLAGHGTTDEKNRYFFLPTDADLKKLRSTAVQGTDIQDTLSAISGKVIAFLDTCHSAAVSGEGRRRGAVDTTAIINELATTDRGAVVFASSTGREVSQENEAWHNGAFTAALLAAFQDGGADLVRDGKITTSELDVFVTERVKELTGATQHPVMQRPPTIPDFPIALAK
jgi:hypothetical protein